MDDVDARCPRVSKGVTSNVASYALAYARASAFRNVSRKIAKNAKFLDDQKRRYFVASVVCRTSASAAVGFAASAQVGEDRDDQVGGEPDVFVAHRLIDVDQDQDAAEEDSEQDVCPLRDLVRREEVREHQQIDQHHDPRGEERK